MRWRETCVVPLEELVMFGLSKLVLMSGQAGQREVVSARAKAEPDYPDMAE